MSTESNKDINRRILEEGFNQGRLAVLDDLIAKDINDHSLENTPALSGGVPNTGSRSRQYSSGLEGVKQFFTDFRRAFPDLHYTIEDVVAEGDEVVTRSYWEGTHQGEFMGIPPTGRHVRVDGVDITRYSKGKAVEHWGYQDTPALMQQLGLNR